MANRRRAKQILTVTLELLDTMKSEEELRAAELLEAYRALSSVLVRLRAHPILTRMRLEAPADAERWFDFVGAILPPRIANEELGDAMEQIHRMYALGRPRWQITLRMWSAIFWAIFHTVTDSLGRLFNSA